MPVSSSADSSRDRTALKVLIAGALAVALVAAPYKAFELDRYFIPKELVLHLCAASAALLCLSTRRRATLSLVDLLLVLFLGASVASAVFAPNLWLAERAVAISLSGATLFWVAGTLKRAGLGRPLLVALAVAIVVGVSTSLAQAYGVRTEYFSLNRSPGGTFGNRNFVAHLAAIGLPVVLLVALTARRGTGALVGAVGVAVLAAALVLSRSRAGWLAVLTLFAPVGLLGIVSYDRWREPKTVRRLVLLAVAATAGVIAAVMLPNRLDWNSDSPYLDSAAGLVNYKEGSGHGRLVQYTNSLHMTRAHVALGVGPGNWPVVYPKFASRHDPSLSQDDDMTSNPWPSSDWVAYLSERGVVGFGLLLAVLLGLLRRAVRDLDQTSRDPERALTAIALVGTLTATAVVGAFDAVLLVAIPAFFVWTLLGVMAPSPGTGLTISTGFRSVGTVLAAGIGVIAVLRSTMQLSSMAVFSSSTRTTVIARSAKLDPASYRLRVKLAEVYLSRGDCTHARPHARAARDLFPNAPEPKRIIASCGGR